MEKDRLQNENKSLRESLLKPSLKFKTAPQVRQTLTSYKRMLKANPLLKYQEAGIDIDEFLKTRKNNLTQAALPVVDVSFQGKSVEKFKKPVEKPKPKVQFPVLQRHKENIIGDKTSRTTIISGSKPLKKSYSKTTPVYITNKLPVNNKIDTKDKDTKRCISEIKPKVKSLPCKSSNQSVGVGKSSNAALDGDTNSKETSSLKRSLSSGYLQNKKGKTFNPNCAYTISDRSQSEENIQTHQNLRAITPILEDKDESHQLVFKTPSAYERRSIYQFTPRSERKSVLFETSTPAPIELQRLQDRLTKWLKSRGKPLATFHHLRCFGIDGSRKLQSQEHIDEENKENVEVLTEKSDSYEQLQIENDIKPNRNPLCEDYSDICEEELSNITKEAILELQKLIEEDYPSSQCLGWLELIKEKYPEVVDKPEYWECRAAIEQSNGNVGNAVEFYKTAIIQGAEVTTVDKSLEQLLRKFSLLNISPSKTEPNVDSKKERIVKEARNVFKSTIIQFAIQERKMKKKDTSSTSNEKKLLITPVKRSTRLSRSGYIKTPGVKLCSSLKEMNLQSDSIDFEKNIALC